MHPSVDWGSLGMALCGCLNPYPNQTIMHAENAITTTFASSGCGRVKACVVEHMVGWIIELIKIEGCVVGAHLHTTCILLWIGVP